jgi:hypothetical protein
MQILRKYIALFFLFCTLLVQTPRSWLHDCHDTEFSTYNHAQSSLEEDCDICNQSALLSDDIGSPEVRYFFSYRYISYPFCETPVPYITGGLNQNKAPPVLPC